MRVWLVKINGTPAFSSPSLHQCAGFVNANRNRHDDVSISSFSGVVA